jgi:hypothetical protein
LALRRFRAERSFERKFQVYSQLFGALADIQRHCTVHLRQIEEGAQYKDDYLDNLGCLASSGFTEIRKAVAVGEFLFSPQSSQRLRQLEEEIEKAHDQRDLHEVLVDECGAVERALRELRSLAKADVAGEW